ncbi:hypothetical protein BJX63DRAFT_62931 [Aspergillus granulosus]|uniref:Uncharacterized protein n=1 Tax=Aspergillus granulosus TaxID=176169 RepID=A0ABR4GYD7_9EURO
MTLNSSQAPLLIITIVISYSGYSTITALSSLSFRRASGRLRSPNIRLHQQLHTPKPVANYTILTINDPYTIEYGVAIDPQLQSSPCLHTRTVYS